MEPFQLVCKSCAAKLKVKNRSAVGQRLACPRCREMILVEAPDGHDIGESLALTGDFDDMDMDSILEKRPQEAPKPIPTLPPRPNKAQPPIRQPTKPALAPGQEWVNPATKKKQRLVLVVMGAIGCLLVLGAVIVSILNWSGSRNDEIAEVPNKDPDDSAVIAEPVVEPKSDSDVAIPVEDKVTPATDATPEEVPGDLVLDTPPEIGAPPMIDGVTETAPKVSGNVTERKTEVEGFGDSPATDIAMSSDPPAVTPSVEVAEPSNELDKLKSILAETGTSLLEIQGAASNVRNELAVGTPKYFFEKFPLELDDPTRRKDQVLLEVTYEKQSLQTVLHELSAISGLVLTIDVPAIAAAGVDFNPLIDLRMENESTSSVVRKVADSVGLAAVETDQGFWITLKENGDLKQDSISIAAIIENEEDAQELIRVIRQFVYPDSWKPDVADPNIAPAQQPKGTINFANGKFELTNTPAAIQEAQDLVNGIKAATRGDLGGSRLLKPVAWLDKGAFAKAYEGENSVRVPIAKFFRKLANEYEVQVIADWRVLTQNDWTTDAMAPSWINERTLGEVVKETAHGLQTSFYVANENTVWLTSPEVANQIFVLKLYPIEKLAGGRLNTERLNRILFDALGPQLNQPGVSTTLLSGKKLAVVRAPQTLQRQIRAVFTAIE